MKNQRVVSALIIGISAMMALQAPITAYASDNKADNVEKEKKDVSADEEVIEVNEEVKSADNEAVEAVASVVGTQDENVVETIEEAAALPEIEQTSSEAQTGESPAPAEEGATTTSEEGAPAGTEGQTPAPASEEQTPAPAAEGQTPAPAAEGQTPAPAAEEGQTPAPAAEEGQTPAPAAEEGQTPAPAGSEGQTPAPVASEEQTPAATEETAKAAQEALEADEKAQADKDKKEVIESVNKSAESITTSENSAAGKADKAASDILEGELVNGEKAPIPEDTAAPGTMASEAIDDLIDKAQAVQDDKDYETGAAAMIVAKDKADTAREEFTRAKEAEIVVDEEKEDLKEDYSKAADALDELEDYNTNVADKAKELLDTINSDEKTYEEKKEAYDNLQKLAEGDVGTQEYNVKGLQAKKDLYETLADNYVNAIDELEQKVQNLDNAKNSFNRNADSALVTSTYAVEEVTAAKEKVDALSKALTAVEDAIGKEQQQAATLAKKTQNSINADWQVSTQLDARRTVMMNVVENYYISQILGIDIITDESDPNFVKPQWSTDNKGNPSSHKGVDTQEYNYSSITYRYYDKDGSVKEETRYFNWDGLTKASTPADFWKNVNTGSKEGIVIFEKSQDEVDANTYLEKFYKEKRPDTLKNADNIKAASRRGEFRVYKFNDGSNDQLIAQLELENEDYRAVRGITLGEDGKYYLGENEIELKEIVQNNNNLLHNANCLILADKGGRPKEMQDRLIRHTEKRTDFASNKLLWEHIAEDSSIEDNLKQSVINSQKFRDYLDNANATAQGNGLQSLIGKYKAYEEATQAAVDAAVQAKGESEQLKAAISELQDNKFKRTALAKDVLKTEDVAGYLGLHVTSQEAAQINNMSVNQLMAKLRSLKLEADDTVKAAADTIRQITEQLGKLTEPEAPVALEDTQKTEPSGEQTPDGQTVINENNDDIVVTPADKAPGDVVVTFADGADDNNDAVTPTDEVKEDNAAASDVASSAESVQDAAPEAPTSPVTATAAGSGSPSIPGAPIVRTLNVTPQAPDVPGNPGDFVASIAAGDDVTITDAAGGGFTAAFANAGDAVANGGAIISDAAQTGAAGDEAATAQNGGAAQAVGAQAGGDAAAGEAAQTVQAGGGAQDAQGGADAVEISDEDVALAGNIDETASEIQDDASQQKKASVDIQDEDVALAEIIPEDTAQQKMSWWWLLVIALLGATGKKMYDEHMKKKEEENKITD